MPAITESTTTDALGNSELSAAEARWWTVALSEDVPEDKLVPIYCDGAEYVLFRDGTGTPRALRDQCAHRRAPLSAGKLTAEKYVECPYHGWRYDGSSGQCVAIPNLSAQEKVPRTYRTGSFPVREEGGFIHLWSGEGKPFEFPARLNPVSFEPERTWHGSGLIAFPHDSFCDLLIDAPGAVLDTPGIHVMNDHRYGDPVLDTGRLVVRYAADDAARARSRKKAASDFPLAVSVLAAIDGRGAQVLLEKMDGQVLATVTLAMYPDRAPLTSVHWRGAGTQKTKMRQNPIELRPQIDPVLVKATRPFASLLRHRQASDGASASSRSSKQV